MGSNTSTNRKADYAIMGPAILGLCIGVIIFWFVVLLAASG